MNRIHSIAIAAILIFTLQAFAQQGANADPNSGANEVEKHMTVLTERLDLTSEQQAKVRPIIAQMQDSTNALMHDENMSRDERVSKAKEVHYKADREVRKMLSDEQKKKLDQLEEEFHSQQHSDLHGAAAPPQR
jgi:hypothetical protein